jgi:Flp pilus assembly protein TadD
VFRRLFIFAGLAIAAFAQDQRVLSSVRGTLVSDEPLAGNRLAVSLVEEISRKQVGRSYVGGDGSFEFRDVPTGVYTIEVAAASGDPFERQTVNLTSGGNQIEIRLPSIHKTPAGAATVSVRELQHPFSTKSKKLFTAAQKATNAGDYLRAVEILRGALNDAAAVPFARMNIGVAYLKAGQPAAAVPELQESARLLPDDASAHTNLAYALLLTKHLDAADVECRRALELDRNSAKARWMMGSLLLSKGSHEEEAVENLRLASREIPKARVILAQFYERRGEKDAAVRELREFLPQASSEDRTTVERWLLKLAQK